MTKMDELGLQGLTEFKRYYERIWNLYHRYGDRVVEVEFEKGEEELKNIFITSNNYPEFRDKIIMFWEKHYQITINCCKDIEKVFSLINSTNISKIYVGSASKSIRVQLLISESFLKKMKKQADNGYVYVLINGCVYEIFIGKNLFEYIIIEKKIPIASMLKDE